MRWRACLSDRSFDPLFRLVKSAGLGNGPLKNGMIIPGLVAVAEDDPAAIGW
jgi:hypothetical protein